MEHTIRLHKSGNVAEIKAAAGANLLECLHANSVDIASPCGGKGTCGKCRVKVSGIDVKPSGKEASLLGDKAISRGYRLACYNSVNSDMDIYLDDSGEASIITEGKQRKIRLEPVVSKQYVALDAPDIHDQSSDMERVLQASGGNGAEVSLPMLRELPGILRKEAFRVTLVKMDGMLAGAEPGDTAGRLYGIAVDIGTTTIAAYLYDLVKGERLDVYSVLNPQKKFGADVISRIEYTLGSEDALDNMHLVIIECINRIIGHFAERNDISQQDIYSAVFVGNTTMMHFLMKLPAGNLAVSPFIPAATCACRFNAKELGLNINKFGYAIMFPSVSAYIGADTVAAVLSSGMYEDDRISLLVDIGTNGEIVLGGREWLYSCSAAAGPAFEGANIRNGVGGVKGAIDRIKLDSGFGFTTIGGEKAIGICGSGIVDAIAGMLSKGIIDETGRIIGSDEADSSLDEVLAGRLVEIDGKNAFLIARSEECAADTDIAITQKDVRELQNAKAAIAAGIRILAKQAGIRLEDIDRVYLAGGFGNYIDKESALTIGLLPGEVRGRIEPIGNAAGAGAVEGLLSSDMLKKSEELKERIRYIELSACPDFMDEYVECMMFE